MKARTASVPDTMLGIAAVIGSLTLLPGMTFGTSAHESPGDDGAVADAAAAAAFDSAPCMPAGVAAAALQVPPGEPGVPMCPDERGELEPCGPRKLFEKCVEEADAAYDECTKDAGFWGRMGCGLERGRKVTKCAIEFLEEVLIPFNV